MSVRNVIVTGAGSGIGRAAALQFVERGDTVICVDRDEPAVQALVAEISSAGGNASAFVAELTEESAVEQLMAAIVEQHGRIDAAFNNAGISDAQSSLLELPLERWRTMLSVNLDSVFLCMKHELRHMTSQDAVDGLRGQIVNNSSGAGLTPAPGQPHYTAAKHAVLGLTRSAAQEFARQGIRVNAVLPGATDTPMMNRSPQPLLDAMASMSPTGKMGTPEDVARVAVWLASPESQWVNGQSIVADGGGIVH